MPRRSASVANEWRSRWGWTRRVIPARLASDRRGWRIPLRVSGAYSPCGFWREATNRWLLLDSGRTRRYRSMRRTKEGERGTQALLGALARDLQKGTAVLGGDDVLHLQAAQFADPDAGVGQLPDDQLVALGWGGGLHPVHRLAAQHPDHPLGQPWHRLAGHLLALNPAPGEELVNRADLVVDGEARQGLTVLAGLVQPVTGEAVKRVLVELGGGGHVGSGAPGEEHVDQAVAVGLVYGGEGEPTARAGGQVVLDEHFQGGGGRRRDDRNLGRGGPLSWGR